jgi:membrane dipeptidase
MKNTALLLSFCLATALLMAQPGKKLHYKAILVDTHNDVLSSAMLDGKDISHRITEGHSDLDRWKEGGLDVQFFSVWTGDKARNKEGFFKDALQEINLLNVLAHNNQDRMILASSYNDVKKGLRQKKLVSLVGVEGGHMIEDDLGKLEELYKQRTRYLTLTWNNSTSWASSAMDEVLNPGKLPHKGLNDFGKQVVRKMNKIGMIVDLSHTGEQTFYDAIAISTKPVLLSHSSVWNICPVFRNVKDEQIKAVAKNGGVICINFYSGFISKEYDERSVYLNGPGKKIIGDSLFALSKDSSVFKKQWDTYYDAEMQKVRPSLQQLVDHIDYIVKLVGDKYVGIGSDFDGIGSLPLGLDDVTSYPKITEELKTRGYSDKSIRRILGKNVLRVMRANFK